MLSLHEVYVQQMNYQPPQTPVVYDYQSKAEYKSIFKASVGAFLKQTGERIANLGEAMQQPRDPGAFQPTA